MNEQPLQKTGAQIRAERRARRNSPSPQALAARAQRQAAMRRRAALAADRLANMKANPFDPAWKISQ